MVAAGGSDEEPWRGWSSCGPSSRGSRSTARSDCEGGQPYSHALLRNHGALVRPELLTALDVKVGDRLAIGKATFTIRGVITTEPGRRVGGFSLGPRVLIDYADLPSTGLLGVRQPRAARAARPGAGERRSSRSSAGLRDEFREEFVDGAIVPLERR